MRKFAVCAVFAAFSTGALMAAAGDGKAIFDTKCKSCHGPAGEGNPGIAKMMKTTIHPLGGAEVQSKSDDQLKSDITKGVGKMKGIALTDKQATDVVAFIRTLKK